MRKEMKKNKMVLAMVVVAALAMVSFAGIALQDSSDAAGTYHKIGTDGAVIIDETSDVDYKIYVDVDFDCGVLGLAAVCPIIITENADYTGTLSIGTLDATYAWVEYAAIKLTNASAVQLTAFVYNSVAPAPEFFVAMFMIGNIDKEATDMPAGTYELIKGAMMLGSATQATDWTAINMAGVSDLATLQAAMVAGGPLTYVSFTGTVEAGELSVTSEDVVGTFIGMSADGALLSGFTASPNEAKAAASAGNMGKLEIDGKATLQYPDSIMEAVKNSGGTLTPVFVTDSVDVTINEGAEVIAGTATGGIVKYVIMDNQSVLTVNGDLKFVYTDATNMGVMDIASAGANVEFAGEGTITYGVDPATTLSTPYPLPSDIMDETGLVACMDSPGLGAAYYLESTTTPSTLTYYFTTLDNAAKKGANPIYLTGVNVIIGLVELPENIEVILTPGAKLLIGTNTPGESGTLIVPEGTTITNDSGHNTITDNYYDVVQGKVEYAEEPLATDEPASDVKIERPGKWIYTDVMTALNNESVSGDVIVLRRDATLKDDATIKVGVELKDASGAVLTVADPQTLTVEGILTSDFGMIIDGGTVEIKSGGVANFGGIAPIKVTLDGTIHIFSGGELNVDCDMGPSVSPGTGVIQIDAGGKANITSGNTEVNDLILVGAAVLTVGAAPTSLTVTGEMVSWSVDLEKKPTLSSEANPVVINGKVTLASGAKATVWGNSNVTDDNFETGVVSTTFYIGSNTYMTLYALATNPFHLVDPSNKMPDYAPQLRDVVVTDWNNDAALNGIFLKFYLPTPSSSPVIGAPDWNFVYAEYTIRQYNVTFSWTPGVTWTYNGILVTDSVVKMDYGTVIKVDAVVQKGYEGTPSITLNGASYTAGTNYTVGLVDDSATFAIVSGSVVEAGSGDPGPKTYWGLTLIEILLIIIVIIIAIIAIIIAIRLLRS